MRYALGMQVRCFLAKNWKKQVGVGGRAQVVSLKEIKSVRYKSNRKVFISFKSVEYFLKVLKSIFDFSLN